MQSYYSESLFDDIQKNKKGSVSIHNETNYLQHKFISGFTQINEISDFIQLPKESWLSELTKIQGETILLQYPDSSSFATNYHLQFFKVEIRNEIYKNETVSNIWLISLGEWYMHKFEDTRLFTISEQGQKLEKTFYRDHFNIWIPPKMFVEKLTGYTGKLVKQDIIFEEYILQPHIITNNELASDLFDCPLFNPHIDFVK